MSKKTEKKEEKKYKTQAGEDYEPAQPKKKVDPTEIPYPDGGWTVQQLVEMNPEKRAAMLGGQRNKEFEKDYLK